MLTAQTGEVVGRGRGVGVKRGGCTAASAIHHPGPDVGDMVVNEDAVDDW